MLKHRFANINDAEMLYKWRLDPTTIEYSLNKEHIAFTDHVNWFSKKLTSKDSYMLIYEIDSLPCGHIRFDNKEKYFLISFVVAPEFRGQGIGYQILSDSIKLISHILIAPKIIFRGIVKNTNLASVRSFEKAGFKLSEKLSECPEDCLLFYTEINKKPDS